jgi:hypothetical protein
MSDESQTPAEDVGALFDSFDLDEYKQGKDANYESRMVKRLLDHFGLRTAESDIRRRSQDLTDRYDLTFAAFMEHFPSFPVYLGMAFIPYVRQTELLDLFKRPTSTKIYQAYRDFRLSQPDDSPTQTGGLIFHWSGLGDMVCHDDDRVAVHGLCLHWKLDRPPRPFFLQELGDRQRGHGFLRGLSEIWSADVPGAWE